MTRFRPMLSAWPRAESHGVFISSAGIRRHLVKGWPKREYRWAMQVSVTVPDTELNRILIDRLSAAGLGFRVNDYRQAWRLSHRIQPALSKALQQAERLNP